MAAIIGTAPVTPLSRPCHAPVTPLTRPLTRREVRVPYSVIYDLRGDKISVLRIYFPMSFLVEQLTN